MTLWPWSQHTLTVINGTEDNNHMIFQKKIYCYYWLLTFPYQDTWAWPRYSPGSQHTLDRKGTPLYTKTALILRNEASDTWQHMKTKVQQLHHKYTITKFCKTVNFTLQSTHVKWVFIASSVAVLGTEHTNKVFLLYKPKDKMTDQSGTSTGEYLLNIIKHYDLVRLFNLFSFSYTGVAQCKIQSKTSDVDTVPIYTCLRRHWKHAWMLIILK